MKRNVFLVPIILFLLSCSNRALDKIEVAERYSISIPSINNFSKAQFAGNSDICMLNDTLWLYSYDYINDTLYMLCLKHEGILKKLAFNHEKFGLNSNPDKRISCKIHSNNLISFYSYWDQKIAFVDLFSSNNEVRVLNLKKYLAENEETFSYYSKKYLFNDEELHFNKIYLDIILHTEEAFKEYFSRKCNFVLNFNSDTTSISYLNYPKKYQQGKYYEELDYYFTSFRDMMIYSFSVCDSLHVYRGDTLYRKVFAGSVRNPLFEPFPLDKLMDKAAAKEYRYCQPRYEELISDKLNNCLYRMFKYSSDCKHHIYRPRDIDFSLIRLNGKLDKTGEFHFDGEKYQPYVIFPVKDGLIISERYDHLNNENRILKFSLVSM